MAPPAATSLPGAALPATLLVALAAALVPEATAAVALATTPLDAEAAASTSLTTTP